DIYVKDTNGEGDERAWFRSAAPFKNITQWSHDGRYLIFDQPDPATGWDIWALPTSGEAKPIPVLRSRYNEQTGHVSPDGKWIAFISDESGRPEAYVTSFPTPGARYQVSTDGAQFMDWAPDGKAVYFVTLNGVTRRADVESGATFRTGSSRVVFRTPTNVLGIAPMPDFKRFLEVVPVGNTSQSSVTVEMNWATALEKH
ncbi:MAG TPA: hypothetical protein VKF80_08505, partial [Candidatus Eisenbacteria bacterium]|nr:hypothetical protein [Candidatus Eisenbacteria bacterium]